MEKQNSHIDEIIVDYLTGSLSLDNKRLLKDWIEQSEENRLCFQRRVTIWTSVLSANEEKKYNKEKAFELFQSRVRKNGIKKHLNWTIFMRYAAIVLVVISFSAYFYKKGETDVKTNFAEIVVEVPIGSSTRLFLPDGTQVWLNAGSRIAYSQGFGVDDRKVQLVGEGYFEVATNEKLPFYVITKDLNISVLGTKFNFRNYEYDADAVVTLLQGKILLSNLLQKEDNITLTPNNRVVLNKKEGKMKLENIEALDARDWTNGYLFFSEDKLSDIAKRLERTYDVRIVITHDSLSNICFYGSFVKQEQNIHDVMDALSSTGKFQYKMDGRKITVY